MFINKKYKKHHKIKSVAKNAKNNLCIVKKGTFGLKVLQFGVITHKQLETIRRIISRKTNRTGKIIINVNFNQALTKKPLLSRMGKGAGAINSWVSYIKKGKIIIEIKDITKKIAVVLYKVIKFRIPFKIKLIKREVFDA